MSERKQTRPVNANPWECLDDPPQRIMRDLGTVSLSESRIEAGRIDTGLPRLQSQLCIAGDLFLATNAPLPNAWRRFWTWALLGWRWKRLG